MRKGKLGYILLALLVLTGLAGTVTDTTLSSKERKQAITMMKETRSDLLNLVKDLSEEQLSFKSAPGKWSIKECAYHAALSERILWSMLEDVMKSPKNTGKRTEVNMSDQHMIDLIKGHAPDGKTLSVVEPATADWKSVDEALLYFKLTRAEHIKYIKTTTEDLRNHVIHLSFGTVDSYQLLLLVATHTSQYTKKIRDVMNDKHFPKK